MCATTRFQTVLGGNLNIRSEFDMFTMVDPLGADEEEVSSS